MLFVPGGVVEGPAAGENPPLFDSAAYQKIMTDPVANSGQTVQTGFIGSARGGKPIPVMVAGNPASKARVVLVSSGGGRTGDDVRYAVDLAAARPDTGVFVTQFEHGEPGEYSTRLAATVLDGTAQVFLLPRVGETAMAPLEQAFDAVGPDRYARVSEPFTIEPAEVAYAVQAAQVGLPEPVNPHRGPVLRTSHSKPRPHARRAGTPGRS